MLDLLGLYLILSTTFTLGKAALQVCSPIAFIGFRMIVSGLLILSFCRMTGITTIIRGWKDLLLFLQVTFFHIYVAYVLEFWALSKLDSALVALLYNLSPFITAFLSYVIYAERFTKPKLVGLLFGLAGLSIPLLYGKSIATGVWLSDMHTIALIALIIAVVSACYGWLLVKDLVVHHRYSPYVINGWSMLVGGIGATITAFFLESYPFISSQGMAKSAFYGGMIVRYVPPQYAGLIYTAACLIGIILISNVLFYNLYGHLLKKYSPTLLSFAGFTTPLYTALFGYFCLSESVSAVFLLSMLCMGIGLIIFYKNEIFPKKKSA